MEAERKTGSGAALVEGFSIANIALSAASAGRRLRTRMLGRKRRTSATRTPIARTRSTRCRGDRGRLAKSLWCCATGGLGGELRLDGLELAPSAFTLEGAPAPSRRRAAASIAARGA